MAGSWYLGPTGDLRELECPEADVNVTDVRYGGVHQALSGARVIDVTGVKMQVDLNMTYLSEAQYTWLEALHTRHIPGPLFLVNPLKRNMLSKQASMSATADFPGMGVYKTGVANWAWVMDFPSAAGPGVRSVERTGLPASSVTFNLDSQRKIPVTAALSYTFSAWMRGTSSKTITFGITWYDITGAVLSSSTAAKSVTTSWARHTHTATAPAGAVLAMPTWNSTTNVSFRSTAVQFEQASAATDWQIGGAVLTVAVDQMTTVSHRFPFWNCAIVLLEA